MKLVYAPRALRDIDEILSYIAERSPQGARNVSLAIEHAASFCARHPKAGGRTNRKDLYRHSLAKYRLTMFYRWQDSGETTQIVRVVRSGRVRNLRRIPQS